MMLKIVIISGALILIMLAYRAIEIKTKKNIISRKLRNHSDMHLLKVWDYSRALLRFISSRVHQFIVSIPYMILKLGKRIFGKAYIRSEKLVHMVKGKGELRKKGSASFFISAISEHKMQLKREREELNK